MHDKMGCSRGEMNGVEQCGEGIFWKEMTENDKGSTLEHPIRNTSSRTLLLDLTVAVAALK